MTKDCKQTSSAKQNTFFFQTFSIELVFPVIPSPNLTPLSAAAIMVLRNGSQKPQQKFSTVVPENKLKTCVLIEKVSLIP